MILYLGRCRHCAFQVHSLDVVGFKELMLSHLHISHHYDFSLVANIPIKDFYEDFLVVRLKDSAEVDIKAFLPVFECSGYWKAQRMKPKNIPIVSGLSSGEFKLFLKSERN